MQDLESALAVIRSAIHDEVTGQRFYDDAARYCIDPWAKEMFATLAKEEDVHTRLLLREYEALTTQGRWIDPEMALASDAVVDITRFSSLRIIQSRVCSRLTGLAMVPLTGATTTWPLWLSASTWRERQSIFMSGAPGGLQT